MFFFVQLEGLLSGHLHATTKAQLFLHVVISNQKSHNLKWHLARSKRKRLRSKLAYLILLFSLMCARRFGF